MESIISAINTYGVFTVLIGFVLWGVCGIVKSRIKAKEKREKQQLDIQDEDARARREIERDNLENERYERLLKTIIEVVQRGPVHTVQEQEADRRVHEMIQHHLDCLVAEGASRAYYFTFHISPLFRR